MPALSRLFARLLTCVAARGPQPNAAFAGDVMSPGWQFSFCGTGFGICVFSPLYQQSHRRHSALGTFALLRPGIPVGARGYLLPRWPGDPEVAWWDYA